MASPKKKDYFSNLPNELLEKIVGGLSKCADKLKLRLVLPKTHHELVVFLLKSHLKRLYVSPTAASLRRFNRICDIPFFRQHIIEVVFIAQAWGDVGEQIYSRKEYRADCMALIGRIDGLTPELLESKPFMRRAFETYEDMVHEQVPQVCTAEDYCSQEWETIGTLKEGLLKLPNVTHIGVQKEIAKPGLNECTLWYREGYPEEMKQNGTQPDRNSSIEDRLATAQMPDSTIEGSGAFLAAVAMALKSGNRLVFLNIGKTRRQLPFDLHSLGYQACYQFSALAPCLNKLTINCEDTDEPEDEDCPTMWAELAMNAINVRELTLYLGVAFIPDFWHAKKDNANASITDTFIKHGQLAQLRKLQIIGQRDKPGTVDNTLFLHFLARHAQTLREVELQGVVLTASRGASFVPQVIEASLSIIRENFKFSRFQMQLYRRDECDTGSCGSKRGAGCDMECESYYIREGDWIHRSVFDALAGRLQVELGGDGCWDFGEFVMRSDEV